MKLSDFILLDVEEKKSTVLHQGVLIGKRSNFDFMVFLFRMQSYYVEAYCNRDSKAIEQFSVFDTVRPLSPYLETIALDDLLN